MNEAAASAQSSGNAKGPVVWLDMDQKKLDDAYDQSVYAPNQQLLAKRRAAASKATLARFGEPLRAAYGPTDIEKLDIYRTSRTNAPVNVYIHGGAWRNSQAKDFAFPAEVFVNAGAHYIVVDFVSVTETGGDLMPMIRVSAPESRVRSGGESRWQTRGVDRRRRFQSLRDAGDSRQSLPHRRPGRPQTDESLAE
jgi:hypothetical protein